MSFNKTSVDDFTIITNGIDNRIQIIRHDETGFYNITKMTKIINRLKKSDEKVELDKQPRGIPLGSSKLDTHHWFANIDTKILINACLEETGLEYVQYELAAGTPKRFAGTYVHRYLYDHFMSWLDKRYVLKVSIILDKLHKEANAKIIAEKDDKIDKLSAKIDKQSEEIHKLLGYAKDTKDSLDDVKDELTETKEELVDTKEEVTIAMNHLTDKSHTSTMNPSNEFKHHYFAVSSFVKSDGVKVLKLISGQKSYMTTTIQQYIDDGHEIIIPMFYNANGIDLRNNCKPAFKEFRKNRLKEINEANKESVKQFNKSLDKEIRKHNRENPNNKRIYTKEKQSYRRILIRDIPIECGSSIIEYSDNKYITFEELIDLIKRVNHITQKNPLSDDE